MPMEFFQRGPALGMPRIVNVEEGHERAGITECHFAAWHAVSPSTIHRCDGHGRAEARRVADPAICRFPRSWEEWSGDALPSGCAKRRGSGATLPVFPSEPTRAEC